MVGIRRLGTLMISDWQIPDRVPNGWVDQEAHYTDGQPINRTLIAGQLMDRRVPGNWKIVIDQLRAQGPQTPPYAPTSPRLMRPLAPPYAPTSPTYAAHESCLCAHESCLCAHRVPLMRPRVPLMCPRVLLTRRQRHLIRPLTAQRAQLTAPTHPGPRTTPEGEGVSLEGVVPKEQVQDVTEAIKAAKSKNTENRVISVTTEPTTDAQAAKVVSVVEESAEDRPTESILTSVADPKKDDSETDKKTIKI